jgi:NAD(P)H-nitrite reductase large subunit
LHCSDNIIAAQSGFDVNRLRLVVGENTLLGALLIGDQTLSLPLQRLVTDQVDISSIRPDLLMAGAAHANLAQPGVVEHPADLPGILTAFWTEQRGRLTA